MENRIRNLMIVTALSCYAVISSFIFTPSVMAAASWVHEEALLSFLSDNYSWEDIEISGIMISGKSYNEKPENIIVERGPIGKAVFSFIYANGSKTIVRANIRAFENIVLSKRPYRKGHVISLDDIYLSKIDIRKMPKSSVRNPDKIIGKSLKRSISANIPLVENMIEMSKVVKRGKNVVLMIHHNGLNITARGMTKEKGQVGMPVKAINISSKKIVTGILIDENTVKVEL